MLFEIVCLLGHVLQHVPCVSAAEFASRRPTYGLGDRCLPLSSCALVFKAELDGVFVMDMAMWESEGESILHGHGKCLVGCKAVDLSVAGAGPWKPFDLSIGDYRLAI